MRSDLLLKYTECTTQPLMPVMLCWLYTIHIALAIPSTENKCTGIPHKLWCLCVHTVFAIYTIKSWRSGDGEANVMHQMYYCGLYISGESESFPSKRWMYCEDSIGDLDHYIVLRQKGRVGNRTCRVRGVHLNVVLIILIISCMVWWGSRGKRGREVGGMYEKCLGTCLITLIVNIITSITIIIIIIISTVQPMW